MTKRPERAVFIEAYDRLEADINALADEFDCHPKTIKNWISLIVDGVESKKGHKVEKLDFDGYHKAYKDSLTKAIDNHVTIRVNRSVVIACLSDTHLGNVHTDIDWLAEDTKLIRDTDGVYAMFVGDILDYTTGGPRGLLNEQVFPQTIHTKDMAEQWIKELSSKMLLMISGCHDRWEYVITGEHFLTNAVKNIITQEFRPDCAFIDLVVGDISYSIFATHKLRGGGTQNPSHGIYRKARENMIFDIGIEAHKHRPGIAQQMIQDRLVTAINCGTYKKIDGYAKQLGIPQQPMSIPGFYVDAERKIVIPLINWRDGLKLL